MSPLRFCIAAAMLALPLLAGCMGVPGEPSRFGDTVNQYVKSWSADAMAFGRLIRSERSPARLRADLDRLTAKIRDLDRKVRALQVPPGEEARDLYSALLTYISDQDHMVSQDFEELISILGGPTPDMERFREILVRCQQTENADLERLHQAEAAYAKASGKAPVGK